MKAGTPASSKSSFHSQSPEVSEIYKDISMKMDSLEEAVVGSQEETGQEPEGISDQEKDEARFGKPFFPVEERQKLFQSKGLGAKESLVSTSTEDTLFQKEEDSKMYPLVSVVV